MFIKIPFYLVKKTTQNLKPKTKTQKTQNFWVSQNQNPKLFGITTLVQGVIGTCTNIL